MNTSLTGRVEGVRSKASDRWASHPLRTSLPALRRVSAADVIVATVVARFVAAHRCRSASPALGLAYRRPLL